MVVVQFLGYRLSRRIGEIEEFKFESLGNGEQLHLAVAVSGWLPDDAEGLYAFFEFWRIARYSQLATR